MNIAPHPDDTLYRLLALPRLMPVKLRRLRMIHALCKKLFDQGSRQFTLAEMATTLEAEGVANFHTYRGNDNPEYRELTAAWQNYCDHLEFDMNSEFAADHPSAVFRKLLKEHTRGDNPSMLRAMHRICRQRYELGHVDFAFRSVNREALNTLTIPYRGKPPAGAPRAFGELTEAWRRLATQKPIANVATSEQSPEVALQAALRKPALKAQVADLYRNINRICEARFVRGEYDFGSIAIAKELVEARVFEYDKRIPSRLRNSKQYSAILDAWQKQADDRWIRSESDLPRKHPDAVYKRISGKPARADVVRLRLEVHRACHLQHAKGSTDFSKLTIGGILAKKGILAQRTLVSTLHEEVHALIAAWDEHARPWLADHERPPPEVKLRRQKSHDVTLEWVRRNHPELEKWRVPAAEWLGTARRGLNTRINVITSLFDSYLSRPNTPNEPADLFRRGNQPPDFREVVGNSTAKHTRNNQLKEFFDWWLLRDFSVEADDGALVVSPEFRNPISLMGAPRGSRHWQSVRSPLPYGYIHELRHMLAQGKSFRDWTLAQRLQGPAEGAIGAPSRDWYDADWSVIDESDPDCVWRKRIFKKGKRERAVYQIWSPVRWVALLVKLLLPLRTGQVRMLDSGESDTRKYLNGAWIDNDHPMTFSNRDLWQQGVFRRNVDPADEGIVSTLLYINTNKTADMERSGPEKGYVMPWFQTNDPIENVFYWLEKLRDWQCKYNPIARRTELRELDARHIQAKTAAQLASYPACCFLFRLPETGPEERMLPVSDAVLSHAWTCLLRELQKRVAARGETHPGGTAIQFVSRNDRARDDALFPLHSLRVSLITALALDGEVPFPILQKLVGHSRLLMTLYYTKPGAARIFKVLAEAAERLSDGAANSIYEFLLNTEHATLVAKAIGNNSTAVANAVAVHPSQRNAAGWMLMHHGICLVGGNVSEAEDNRKIGGCYNGGPEFGRPGEADHAPVPGGSRNCIRCRWFVTEPHFLFSLTAHFNTTAYHFDEARNNAMDCERALQQLRREKAAVEASGGVFTNLREFLQAERLAETGMKRFSDLAEDLVACWRLIERCKAVLNAAPTDGMQLVIQGAITDVRAVFEETESELLQLCGVCDSIELYPDLEADKAVLRRSQLLDSALLNDGLPPMFLKLSTQDQLKVGNAFVRRLSDAVAPNDPFLGQRTVVGIIDAGGKLGDALGIDLLRAAAELSSQAGAPHRLIRIAASQ